MARGSAEECVHAMEALVGEDVNGRGIAPLVVPHSLYAAAAALATCEPLASSVRVLLLTGFAIPIASPPAATAPCGRTTPPLHADGVPRACGETDGPPGVAALIRALAGAHVVVATDALNAPLVRAACGDAPPARVWVVDAEGRMTCDDGDARVEGSGEDAAVRLLEYEAITHVVSVERVGRAADGHYRNMRARCVDAYTPPVDVLALPRVLARVGERACGARARIVSIGVGDGGNEVGMGNVAHLVASCVPHGAEIACVVRVDTLVVAAVSNWGAYALAAAVSVLRGRGAALLVDEEEACAAVARVVAAGGVDGVTHCAAATVDGLPLEDSVRVLRELRALAAAVG